MVCGCHAHPSAREANYIICYHTPRKELKTRVVFKGCDKPLHVRCSKSGKVITVFCRYKAVAEAPDELSYSHFHLGT